MTLRNLDYPPVWLFGLLLIAWVQVWVLPLGGPGAFYWTGTLLVVGGIALMALAVPQFLRARTTIVPHRAPAALVTSGIYGMTRNPIYLGDTLILLGLILRWGAWPSLLLLPAFVAVITARFILPEEARLKASFGEAFSAYAERTRRWI